MEKEKNNLQNIPYKVCDVVIVGSGLAGLYTAMHLDPNLNVYVVTKEKIDASNSYLAQGGIAGEISTDPNVLEQHIKDTIIAAGGMYDEQAIHELVYDAKENLEYLINLGVPFDLDSKGKIELTKEGGHASRRILHAGGDATGMMIMLTMYQKIKECKNVKIFEDQMMYDLIKDGEKCIGVKLISQNNELINIFASHVVMATGGLGFVYKDSTNAVTATGDGVAAAYRAGVEIANMEFVQFHPTVFFDVTETAKGHKFLISEALRGEGAFLRNIDGERFMSKYDKRLELAPRDIVSQSIVKEMYDTWSNHVYIDARHLGKEFLMKRFPTIYNKCAEFGYHMEEDMIPVAPVEHYACGGIKVGLNGETSLENLYACGECSCTGVHGANRLASNSLLECLVFGKRIAMKINKQKPSVQKVFDLSIRKNSNHFNYHSTRSEIRSMMNQYVFIVRNKEGLELAEKVINRHYNNLVKHPYTTIDYYRTLNIATVAKIIVDAALARKESIGCHLRID